MDQQCTGPSVDYVIGGYSDADHIVPYLAQALLLTKDSLGLSLSEGASWRQNLNGLYRIARDLQSKRLLHADVAYAVRAAAQTGALLGTLTASLRHQR